MTTATKLGGVVTYNEEVPFMKSQDPLTNKGMFSDYVTLLGVGGQSILSRTVTKNGGEGSINYTVTWRHLKNTITKCRRLKKSNVFGYKVKQHIFYKNTSGWLLLNHPLNLGI